MWRPAGAVREDDRRSVAVDFVIQIGAADLRRGQERVRRAERSLRAAEREGARSQTEALEKAGDAVCRAA